jgi:MYXO-CTERM domain-containing protein
LFVHDDGTLRPVDEASARAWRFDVAAAENHDGDEGLTIGDDWPARPILLRDTNSDAYLLDGDAASGPPGFGVGGDDAGGAASDEASCGCSTPGEPRRSHAWAMLLGLLALAWRRRASRR